MNFLLVSVIIIIVALIIQRYHDISLPRLMKQIKLKNTNTNIAFIFPHPDDETITSSGLFQKLIQKKHITVHVVCITRGEKGDERLKLPPYELAEIREKEFLTSMKILRVKHAVIESFPDSGITNTYDKVKAYIQTYISHNKIDTVVTFERTGMYGHQDHVAVSKMIHELQKELQTFKTLYATMPLKMELRQNLRIHIRNLELSHFDQNEPPEYTVLLTPLETLRKYRAAKAYKSQILSHRKPLWAKILMEGSIEYFTEKYGE